MYLWCIVSLQSQTEPLGSFLLKLCCKSSHFSKTTTHRFGKLSGRMLDLKPAEYSTTVHNTGRYPSYNNEQSGIFIKKIHVTLQLSPI